MERESSLSNPEPLDETHSAATEVKSRSKSAIWRLWSPLGRLLSFTIFSSLTRRIVVLNLAALAALVIAILYLNQWRAGLIDARVDSLRVQGEIIAGAIAASATVNSDVITVDPDKFLQLQSDDTVATLSFFSTKVWNFRSIQSRSLHCCKT